jgi:hypothetical protein
MINSGVFSRTEESSALYASIEILKTTDENFLTNVGHLLSMFHV